MFYKYSLKSFTKYSDRNFFIDYFRFIIKKIINLGIPYFTFSILYVLLTIPLQSDMHTYYSISSVFSIVIKPIAQYWYLHSLIIIFILAPFISGLCSGNIKAGFFIALILSISTLIIKYPFQSPIENISTFFLGCLIAETEKNWKVVSKKFIPLFWLSLFIFFLGIFILVIKTFQWSSISNYLFGVLIRFLLTRVMIRWRV